MYDSIGLDVENLTFPYNTTRDIKISKISNYIAGFSNKAKDNGLSANLWYSGDWDPSNRGAAGVAPDVFNRDITRNLKQIHWMDLPKLYQTDGTQPNAQVLRYQLRKLLVVAGKNKSFIQLGFLKDLNSDPVLQKQRIDKILAIAQDMGFRNFSIYIHINPKTANGISTAEFAGLMNSIKKSK